MTRATYGIYSQHLSYHIIDRLLIRVNKTLARIYIDSKVPGRANNIKD